MTDLTPERIAELRALEANATEGEWEVRYVLDEPRYGLAGVAVKQTSEDRTLVPMSGSVGAMSFTEFVIQEKYTTDHSVANAAFIAALRNAAPALIAAVEERDELRKAADMAEYEMHVARDRADALHAERDAAYTYAKNLCEAFVAKHFPPNPDWRVLPDLIGVLTQIDNATTVTSDLRALLVRAGEALEPFAKAGQLFDQPHQTNYDMAIYSPVAGKDYHIYSSDLRQAQLTLDEIRRATQTQEPPA